MVHHSLSFDKRKLLLNANAHVLQSVFQASSFIFCRGKHNHKIDIIIVQIEKSYERIIAVSKNWSQSGKNKLIFGFGAPDIPQKSIKLFWQLEKKLFLLTSVIDCVVATKSVIL